VPPVTLGVKLAVGAGGGAALMVMLAVALV